MIDPTYGVASAVSSALYGAFSETIVTVPAASSAVTLFAPAVPVTYEVYGPWVDGENAYRSESAITLGVIGVPSEQVTPLRIRNTAPLGVSSMRWPGTARACRPGSGTAAGRR